jgi:hypothetical protein
MPLVRGGRFIRAIFRAGGEGQRVSRSWSVVCIGEVSNALCPAALC